MVCLIDQPHCSRSMAGRGPVGCATTRRVRFMLEHSRGRLSFQRRSNALEDVTDLMKLIAE